MSEDDLTNIQSGLACDICGESPIASEAALTFHKNRTHTPAGETVVNIQRTAPRRDTAAQANAAKGSVIPESKPTTIKTTNASIVNQRATQWTNFKRDVWSV